jgi:hypothetical protein
MTHTPEPYEAADVEITEAELIAVDHALDGLAGRLPTVPADPALTALAEFARAVDARVAAVTPDLRPVIPPTPRRHDWARPDDRHARARLAGRSRLRRTLKGIPIAIVALTLALLAGVPLNSSPDSPLYPLHQLIFESRTPSPADSVRLNLANARQALDDASRSQGSTRAARLDSARRHLAEARRLAALMTDPHARSQLYAELSSLDQRASRMAENNDQQSGDTSTSDPGQGNQHGQDGTHTTESPTSGSNGGPNVSSSPDPTEQGLVGSS